jgi:hypothetical protein
MYNIGLNARKKISEKFNLSQKYNENLKFYTDTINDK